MCRVLSYLGKPISVEELMYKTDNSFIKQSYHPKYMSNLLNLAGFGLVAWDKSSNQPDKPFLYKTQQLPFYDDNLRNLSAKISPQCLLAHLRGVPYSESQIVSTQNVHPFLFPNATITLAHNGALHDFEKMKYDLLNFILPEYQIHIHGTTDSEWIYAILVSQLHEHKNQFTVDAIGDAIISTLKILQKVRQKHGIAINSPVNLFITNGQFIAATRFVFDFGKLPGNAVPSTHFAYHSLWYTSGESYGYYDDVYKMKPNNTKSSIIISSEPLTEDTTTWVEVPEYALIIANLAQSEIKITTHDISL